MTSESMSVNCRAHGGAETAASYNRAASPAVPRPLGRSRRRLDIWPIRLQYFGPDAHEEDWAAFFAEDASFLPPNEPLAVGREAARKVLAGFLETPGFAVSWRPTKVEASRGGDLGYSVGTYELSLNDPEGKPMQDRGKYVTVWKKQPDGSWKVVADIFNSDLPAPGAAM